MSEPRESSVARPPATRATLARTLSLASEREPACAMCGGPWRELGHCKGVCLRCGFMQSCVDTL